jgi:UDP-3-O-[3-hydroxymyristoyl] glucosamine N-acyltransferase
MVIRPSDICPRREIVVAVSASIHFSPPIGGGTRGRGMTVSNHVQIRENAVLCEQCVIGRDVHIDPSTGRSVRLGMSAQDVQFRETLAAEPVL